LSGYSIHLQLQLRTAGSSTFALGSDDQKRYEPNQHLWDKQMNLLCVMVHDKALVLRQDAVTVSE